MNVNFPNPQRPIGAPLSAEQAGSIRNVRSTHQDDPVDQARKRFLDEGEDQYLSGNLSAKGYQLLKAVVNPDKPGAPGVQVSTFAVDGVQSKDMLVVKRVPPTADGPNFLVYIPDEDVTSFHEFNTAEKMTEWFKSVANDPDELARFARHFSHPEAPNREERVRQKMRDFAAGDINAVVGSYGFEKGDIFERLNKDVTVPPVPVDGLTQTQFHGFGPNGSAFYKGVREKDGAKVLYTYDAYGNLHGSSEKKEWYFVQNGLNDNTLLEPMTFNQYRSKVTSVSLDNVGANNLSGLYDEFLKQLRNPGHGLGTALKALGVPDDVANSIEEIFKNPVKGTLLELNHNNRLGNLFGVDKEKMDELLESIGSQAQRRIPRYGKLRSELSKTADVIERYFGTPEQPTTQVKT